MRRWRTGRKVNNFCGDGGQVGRWITGAEIKDRQGGG